MTVIDTTHLADELLAAAREAPSGRAARSLRGGRDVRLRHTLVALVAGAALADHENPGEATLCLLRGRATLTAGDESWKLSAGDYVGIPPRRHGVTAHEDSVFLLTIVTA